MGIVGETGTGGDEGRKSEGRWRKERRKAVFCLVGIFFFFFFFLQINAKLLHMFVIGCDKFLFTFSLWKDEEENDGRGGGKVGEKGMLEKKRQK